jgi:hypothetical protein
MMLTQIFRISSRTGDRRLIESIVANEKPILISTKIKSRIEHKLIHQNILKIIHQTIQIHQFENIPPHKRHHIIPGIDLPHLNIWVCKNLLRYFRPLP